MQRGKFLTLGFITWVTFLIAIAAEASLIGQPAPDFTAESSEGTLTLSDYQGKKNVVLAFYFADFTPV